MKNKKTLRDRGKIKLSKYFQKFEKGDRVAVIKEPSLNPKFPKKLQGRSGIIENKRGNSYLVRINDLNKQKGYIIHPVHLKKLKNQK
ncbi:50S ribosomal protein L21e [Candidatus Pacearchaeota archaeon]|nr:50S ribosomal protein L21e [Candidatus Pacearchaeota archaeon]MBD3283192.1 50S ribosomal protein L21e [Candidatus Pacearchaeota archaeon]